MKIKLVFHDVINTLYKKAFESEYRSEIGLELTSGDFHSGSTFRAEIELTSEQQEQLENFFKEGLNPVFYVIT